MKLPTLLILGIIFIQFFSCQNSNLLKPEEGFLEVEGGKIWYEVFGSGNKTPILVLHGGPGYPSYYLNPLKKLANDRSVILFDQLGCGRSDILTDTNLMTIDAHVAQTRKLIEHLKIEKVIIYGHSWGTTLGTEYYKKYPDNIEALILGSPCIDSDMWQNDSDKLVAQLPDSIRIPIENHINKSIPDTTALNKAIDYFYDEFYTRKRPHSEAIIKADSSWYAKKSMVYEYMFGVEEYSIDGTLKGYDGKEILKMIQVPVLYITGEYDTATPSTVKEYNEMTPNSRLKVIENAGHQTLNDNEEIELNIIESFLSEFKE
ncbi:proline iminopeptidase-family hydrolase [Maribacter antarcticus]|uniref:proline iminopeptidase-family hydrolase n=1 Tax=Maribacter antarcticus TaxID=505250 RepID=UPI00047B9A86|nr:proline iminopeptidase-family hydrolase [Maribacter antarcticus]